MKTFLKILDMLLTGISWIGIIIAALDDNFLGAIFFMLFIINQNIENKLSRGD